MNAAASHIVIGDRSYACTDLANASSVYQTKRDDSGEGASTFPHGKVYRGEHLLAEVSYNGRVWTPRMRTKTGAKPLMEAAS